jgi:hypothetical protein
MEPAARPLAGLRVGVSVSGSGEDLARRGFTESGLNRLTVRLSRALLAEGAALAFGHDWREGGVMEAIASIAFDYRLPAAPQEVGPAIVNLIPWPDVASATDPTLLARLARLVEVTPALLPEELRPLEAQALAAGPSSPTWRYLRARGLTHLRRRLAERCHARVALGGRLSGFDGRLPGIVEEVFFTCAAARPVYLAGLLGGAAEILGAILVNGRPADDLRRALERPEMQPLAEIYARHATPSAEGVRDSDLNLPAIAAFLAGDGSHAALAGNGLTREQNLALLSTDLEEQVTSLVVLGLRRVAERTPPPAPTPSTSTAQEA